MSLLVLQASLDSACRDLDAIDVVGSPPIDPFGVVAHALMSAYDDSKTASQLHLLRLEVSVSSAYSSPSPPSGLTLARLQLVCLTGFSMALDVFTPHDALQLLELIRTTEGSQFEEPGPQWKLKVLHSACGPQIIQMYVHWLHQVCAQAAGCCCFLCASLPLQSQDFQCADESSRRACAPAVHRPAGGHRWLALGMQARAGQQERSYSRSGQTADSGQKAGHLYAAGGRLLTRLLPAGALAALVQMFSDPTSLPA